jgi:hypothetical protein
MYGPLGADIVNDIVSNEYVHTRHRHRFGHASVSSEHLISPHTTNKEGGAMCSRPLFQMNMFMRHFSVTTCIH